MRGLGAVFFFFFANLSFYLVMTLFMQNALHFTPLQSGAAVIPLALAFVVASRQGAARARHRGTLVLIEGCAVELLGLITIAATVTLLERPAAWMMTMPLMIFGYGQGLVMAPLSSAVLSTVHKASAGAGSGLYGTTTQIANAAGVAVIGAVYFSVHGAGSDRLALIAALTCVAGSIGFSVACLAWMRRV
jgi:hypothetical protein